MAVAGIHEGEMTVGANRDFSPTTPLRTGGVAMTPEKREEMNSLCERIQKEQDHPHWALGVAAFHDQTNRT